MNGLVGKVTKTRANPRFADARRLPYRRNAPVPERFGLRCSPQPGHALVHHAAQVRILRPNLIHSHRV